MHCQTISIVYLILAKFLSSKGSEFPEKIEYAHLHSMSFLTTTFHEILLSSFRGETGLPDWLTDRLTKNIIASTTRCVVLQFTNL